MSRIYKIFLVLTIFLFCLGLFLPLSADAVTDQRCWQREACEYDNGVFYGPNAETITACKKDKDEFGKDIGFCTATGNAITQVGFGGEGEGKRSFENFGKFIQWIYRYGIMIAGILAMIMLVVAGLQWVTSAGSPERITSAKKRIGNALMGLFVALISYFLLSTINPYLVNLRLPQVWKLNTISIDVFSKYCVNLPTNDSVVEVKGEKDLTKVGDPFEPYTKEIPKDFWQTRYVVFDDRHDMTECGKFYLPLTKKTEDGICRGGICPESSYCDIATNKCVENVELKNISGGGIVGSIDWKGNKYLDKIWLKVICTNGKVKDIDNTGWFGLGSDTKSYKFEGVAQKGIDKCGSADDVEGYFFIVQANDDDTWNTNDDEWAGGISFCKSTLSPASCGVVGANGIDGSDIEENYYLSFLVTDSLFKHFYMDKGIVCNFYLEEKSMPDIGTSFLGYAAEGAGEEIWSALGIKAKVDFGKEIYFMGKGYDCPYIEDRYDFFVKTIKKKKENLKNK